MKRLKSLTRRSYGAPVLKKFLTIDTARFQEDFDDSYLQAIPIKPIIKDKAAKKKSTKVQFEFLANTTITNNIDLKTLKFRPKHISKPKNRRKLLSYSPPIKQEEEENDEEIELNISKLPNKQRLCLKSRSSEILNSKMSKTPFLKPLGKSTTSCLYTGELYSDRYYRSCATEDGRGYSCDGNNGDGRGESGGKGSRDIDRGSNMKVEGRLREFTLNLEKSKVKRGKSTSGHFDRGFCDNCKRKTAGSIRRKPLSSYFSLKTEIKPAYIINIKSSQLKRILSKTLRLHDKEQKELKKERARIKKKLPKKRLKKRFCKDLQERIKNNALRREKTRQSRSMKRHRRVSSMSDRKRKKNRRSSSRGFRRPEYRSGLV
ncbi:unnamed protein product [Moneuplotes crassus]|uniref:Uncharacterized protein n=1 Tax=Euplotes crassus TaxID=5936 RepID=A0AAD1X8K1_EUPCR|nr:unnamed protein product [Moneuplotes crassus]